jgi:hypothetical protein
LVRHRDEQLSIAIGFQLEPNLVCSPRVESAKQLSVTNSNALAADLFLATFARLTRDCVCFWYWKVQYFVPNTPLLEFPRSGVVHSFHTAIHDAGTCLENQFPPSTLWFFGMYSALSGGNGSGPLQWLHVQIVMYGNHARAHMSPSAIVPIAKVMIALIACQIITPLVIISITMGMISRAIIPGAVSSFLASMHSMIGQTHAWVWLLLQRASLSNSESWMAANADSNCLSSAVAAPVLLLPAFHAASSSTYFGWYLQRFGNESGLCRVH